MFCTACGTRNGEINNFCKQCGHKLDHAAGPRITEEEFDRALPTDEQVSALLERAYRLRKSGELSSAVRLCEEALHLNPESTSVHSLLGQIQEQIGNHEAAIHEYERVLQLNPGSIADRVKLDELRGQGLPTPLHPRSAPHIVMPNRSLPNPNGRQMLGIAAIAGTLMVMGGLLALQFFNHQDKNNHGAPSAFVDPNPKNRFAGKGTPTDPSTVPGASSTGSENTANPSTVASNTGVVSQPPVTTSPNGPAAPAPQNVYVKPQLIYVHDGGSPQVATRTGGGLPNMGGSRTQAGNDTGGDDRVHLDGNEKPITIDIHPDGVSGDNGGTSTQTKGGSTGSPKNSGGGKGSTPTPPVIPPKIKVNFPTDNGNAGGNVAPPTADSQAHLVVASDKAKNGDYETAIKNYRLALSGANSQTGYVYQQMGTCFQRIKDKASAISSFSSAIAEYQKLESANQQVDLARAGIKVCQNGIKLCNIE
ncbi:MAG: Tetratricopeptide repeat [Chthonomonadales bacterium]|nr:Tetratricopeptide repeat [Chthonomonadales bacterium]